MLYDSFKLKFKNMQLMCTEESSQVGYHNHAEFEILIITKGNPEIIVGDKTYNVKKGDLLFINPMEVHAVNIKNNPYSLKCICFDPLVVHDKKIYETITSDTQRICNYIDCDLYDTSKITDLFNNIFNEYELSNEWSDSLISLYVTEMYIHLLQNGFVSDKKQFSKASVFCSDVLKYISAHYSENITSSDVSNAFAYSQEYFCRKFQQNFGQSFSNYLNIYRISMAKILLEDKGSTVADVAYGCGFSSPEYFSKIFKKTVGMLPSEYKIDRKHVKKRG